MTHNASLVAQWLEHLALQKISGLIPGLSNNFPCLSYLWQGKQWTISKEDDCGQTMHKFLLGSLYDWSSLRRIFRPSNIPIFILKLVQFLIHNKVYNNVIS